MYFTSGSDRAFEQLMQGKPGFDHYDSGEAVTPEDCGTCRFYRPHWKYQFCVYAECPYQPGKLTAYDAVTFRVKGVENMAVFRVERNKGYTVMSNHHLRNKDLSLKAKGLLSQMLSLPEDWDYTLKGLSLINREQIDAIRAAIRELEQAGYIVRSRERDSQGRLRGADYVIYEQPQPVPDSPTLENPMLDNPTQEKPTLGKPTQLNKDISSKEKSITDVSITDPIPIPSTSGTSQPRRYRPTTSSCTMKRATGSSPPVCTSTGGPIPSWGRSCGMRPSPMSRNTCGSCCGRNRKAGRSLRPATSRPTSRRCMTA